MMCMKNVCYRMSRRLISVYTPLIFVFLTTVFVVSSALAGSTKTASLHEGFVSVADAVPDVIVEVRYYTEENFLGTVVDGYYAPKVILSEPAAKGLIKAQEVLAPFGLVLKVFDGYRPQMAVDHFVRWAKDLDDTKRKATYYPDVQKKHLFRDGYIAAKSGHTRGSTVDVTLVDKATGNELDMGTGFDFFGPKSWPDNKIMSVQVRSNRALLQRVMSACGFKHLKEEWWHFTLRDEPYPDTYFTFPIR
ncbi:MAG: M15 family metallopeptidase [Desulfovibrio sp.]